MFKIVLAFWSKQAKNIIWLDEIKLKKKKIQKRLQTDRTTKCTNCYLLIIDWHYVLIYQCDHS